MGGPEGWEAPKGGRPRRVGGPEGWRPRRVVGGPAEGGSRDGGRGGREGGVWWDHPNLGHTHENLDTFHTTIHKQHTTHHTTTTTTQHNTKQHNTQNRSGPDICQSRVWAGGSGWGQSGSTLDWPNSVLAKLGQHEGLAKVGFSKSSMTGPETRSGCGHRHNSPSTSLLDALDRDLAGRGVWWWCCRCGVGVGCSVYFCCWGHAGGIQFSLTQLTVMSLRQSGKVFRFWTRSIDMVPIFISKEECVMKASSRVLPTFLEGAYRSAMGLALAEAEASHRAGDESRTCCFGSCCTDSREEGDPKSGSPSFFCGQWRC